MEYILKVSEIGLKLLTDVKMILDYENGIWGGITKPISRYAEANNKYMHGCDKTKERSCISYLHFINQYGWALSKRLFCIGFELIEDI